MTMPLQGSWWIAPDPENQGRTDGWCEAVRGNAQPAPVPGIVQQAFPGLEGVFWYYHEFLTAPPPDNVVAAAFAVGYCCPGGYNSGVVVGSSRHGRGQVILSSLDILGQIGRHPAADRILLNLVQLKASER